MTEKKAVYRTHSGKVLHAAFAPTILKMGADTTPYRISFNSDGGQNAKVTTQKNARQSGNLELGKGSDTEEKSDL